MEKRSDILTGSCAVCGAYQGRAHLFYYGRKLRQEASFGMKHIQYEVASSRSVSLCNRCVLKERLWIVWRGLFLAALAIGLGFADSIVRGETWSGLLVAGTLLAGLGSLAFLWEALSSRQEEIGDRKAIELNRKELEAQGYDSFWTRKEYKALRR